MKRKILLLFALILSTISYGQDFDKGKELFNQNCAACHNMEKKMVGPALQNVVQEQGRDWTKEWIYNSQALIESGDEHANEVWKEYNMIAMPAYNWLDDSDLESIVTYIEKYTEVREEQLAAMKPKVEEGVSQSIVVSNPPTPTYIKIIITISLIVILLCFYGLYLGLTRITYFIETNVQTNKFLLDKMGIDRDSINKEINESIENEVQKRVDEKIKILKTDINTKLKNFK